MSTEPDRIDVEMAAEYLHNGQALAIDVRPSTAQVDTRIPGAVRVPADEQAIDKLLARLPRELLWIVYCDEPGQSASLEVARRARDLALADASVLEGGFRAWKRAGRRTEHVPAPEART